jgi:hypothetical protein
MVVPRPIAFEMKRDLRSVDHRDRRSGTDLSTGDHDAAVEPSMKGVFP